MREFILCAVVFALCCIALVKPLFGLYGYVWFALMRPDVLAWSYGRYPYSLALAVTTVLGSLRYYFSFGRILRNPICLLLIAFQIPVVISVFMAPVPAYCWDALGQFERANMMALLIPALIATRASLERLVLLMGFSLGVLGTKFGLFGILAGGVRFSEGFGGMLSDNNDLALALAMAIPPMWHLRQVVEFSWGRLVLVGMTFCTVAAIIMTYSRGGAVTLAVVLFMLIMRSRHKLGAAILIVLLAAPAVYMVGETYQQRVSTIMDPTQEASANSRFELSKAAFHMWLDYPLTGVGFGGGNFARMNYLYTTVQNGSVAHNSYMQVLVDTGIFGALCYLTLLWGTILWLGLSIRRTRREVPELVRIPWAIQSSLIAFAVGSTFLSRVTLDITYMYLMAAASWWAVARQERALALMQEQEEATEISGQPEPAVVS